jgi:hypothetical protein
LALGPYRQGGKLILLGLRRPGRSKTEGAAGQCPNPPPSSRSTSTLSLSISPATYASVGSLCRGSQSCQRDGGVRVPAPPAAWAGRLGGVGPSAPRKRLSRRALYESGLPAGPLRQGEPPIVSLSPCPSRARRVPAAAMNSLPPHGEATICRSSPPRHWARHHSTPALTTDLCWRKRRAPPPSNA